MREAFERLCALIKVYQNEPKYTHVEFQMCDDGSGEIVGTHRATCGCCAPDTKVILWWNNTTELIEIMEDELRDA